MEFQELIRARYSVRAYKPDLVKDDVLDRILNAARLAPSAANRQPIRLVVATTKGKEEEFRKVYAREWFVEAPIVICACGIQQEAWVRRDGKSYLDVDVAIAMDHLILAAANEGVGTCWIAAFDAEAARSAFDIPPEIEPILLTPLGYPLDELSKKERKPLDNLVFYEKWGGTKQEK